MPIQTTKETLPIIKIVGMIHIKGVNDERWNKFIAKQTPAKPLREIPMLPNRW